MKADVKHARPGKLTDVCAVVMTNHPGRECLKNLAVLASQVRQLMIVDSGSPERSLAPIEAAAYRLGATIVRFASNLGTGAALNLALANARKGGFKWLATFDQDSRPSMAMLEQMLALLATYPDREHVGLVTPVQVEESLGVRSTLPLSLAEGPGWRLLASALSTGNLVNVAAASRVGGFDASLFSEYVDHDFCMRLRRDGQQILEASDVRLMCRMGKLELRDLFGKRPRIWHHSSERRYYITRNRALLWRRYFRFDRRWIADDLRNFLYETAGIVLWEKDVPRKLWMMARGLFDAARNVRGALPGR